MKRRRAGEALALLAAVFLSVQAVAAFVYNVQHPELTQMQVLMAAGEWAIPFRWV